MLELGHAHLSTPQPRCITTTSWPSQAAERLCTSQKSVQRAHKHQLRLSPYRKSIDNATRVLFHRPLLSISKTRI
jgi:hypothetical protein